MTTVYCIFLPSAIWRHWRIYAKCRKDFRSWFDTMFILCENNSRIVFQMDCHLFAKTCKTLGRTSSMLDVHTWWRPMDKVRTAYTWHIQQICRGKYRMIAFDQCWSVGTFTKTVRENFLSVKRTKLESFFWSKSKWTNKFVATTVPQNWKTNNKTLRDRLRMQENCYRKWTMANVEEGAFITVGIRSFEVQNGNTVLWRTFHKK